MRYRRLGATDLTVSEIGIGCARLGGFFDRADRASQVLLLQRALELGVTFFDTSDLYSQGESERLLGEALKGVRQRAVIATKVGYRPPMRRSLVALAKPLLRPILRRAGIKRERVPASLRGSLSQDFSPSYIVEAAERSLRRLGTDYIDLYQLHSPPRGVIESGEFLGALERLKAAGKIRHYGVSCETVGDSLRCLEHPCISSIQVALSLLEPAAANEAIPRAAMKGLGVIARQCFASGLLARSFADPELERILPDITEREVMRDKITRIRRLADDRGLPLTALALQFAVSVPGVSVTLVGIRTGRHLDEAVRDAEAPRLSDPVHHEIGAPASLL